VVSALPSSTNTISASGSLRASQSRSSPNTGVMFSASLYAKTMIDRLGARI
jgi:hypothetical protein